VPLTPVKKVEHKEDAPEQTTTTPGPLAGRERWWLIGGHLGYAVPFGGTGGDPDSIEGAVKGVVPIGFDIGLWLTERVAAGVTLENGPGVPADCVASCGGDRTRAGLWLELHTSKGPGPEPWLGLGLGGELLRLRGQSNDSDRLLAFGALRAGLDFHASERVRIGPFLEGSVGSYPADSGWIGVGLRLGVDFFRDL
jgi:hypothetical protein